nr:PH domain-containing protein [Planctomonas sp. JC2975]
MIVRHNFVWPAIGIAVVIIAACVGVFALSWRVQTFRVTRQAVELRSGILRRQERKARLDRIQGINVHRPLFARIFGAAKLEIVVAGHDANLDLSYLPSKVTETLRREILRRASGVQAHEAGQAEGVGAVTASPESAPVQADPVSRGEATRNIVADRVDEFLLSPADLDPDAAPQASVVRMHPLRLAGSLLLSGPTMVLFLIVIAMIVGASTGRPWLIIIIFPAVLSLGGLYARRFTKALRYNIAGSGHGVRIGFGLLTTSSETIPPRRVHAVEVLQPLAWRPFGWWQIRMNTAGHTRGKNSAGESRTTTLPVGSIRDVQRVLPLLLPGMDDTVRDAIAHAAMRTRADQSAFSSAPRRAAWLRPFSWSKTGYTVADGVIVFRHGAVWRRIIFVPLARLQSVEVEQGPARRILNLASADVHIVDGPVHAKLPVIDVRAAEELFGLVSAGAIAWADAEAGPSSAQGAGDSVSPVTHGAEDHEPHAEGDS